MQIAASAGIGAQFGGRHMALGARVVRLSRHGGSCPVSLGVSCNAHRNMAGMISADGIFLEKLDRNPSRLIESAAVRSACRAVSIDLDRSMPEILVQLGGMAPGTLLMLNGTLTVARDLAHARISATIRSGGEMPSYMKEHPVYYAGPAKKPEGRVTGSFGPTTSRRMDGYMESFMQKGACLVSLGKGSRSAEVDRACRKYGGFYLGTIGGAAALIAEKHIESCEILDFPQFGMEAVYRIKVSNLPAFVLCNDKGESFYSSINSGATERGADS